MGNLFYLFLFPLDVRTLSSCAPEQSPEKKKDLLSLTFSALGVQTKKKLTNRKRGKVQLMFVCVSFKNVGVWVCGCEFFPGWIMPFLFFLILNRAEKTVTKEDTPAHCVLL